jgi:hypothetical protein
MRDVNKWTAALLAGLAATSIAACSDNSGPFENGPLEEAGENFDEAVDDAGDAIDEATEDLDDN